MPSSWLDDMDTVVWVIYSFFLKIFTYFFLEGKGGKHQCVVASWGPPIGDLARKPGMCPDWEWNQWLFGSQMGTQSTELHQPEQVAYSLQINQTIASVETCYGRGGIKWEIFLGRFFVHFSLQELSEWAKSVCCRCPGRKRDLKAFSTGEAHSTHYPGDRT